MKTSDNEFIVKVFFDENGSEVEDILKKSIMIWIEKEVKEICQKNSWLL